MTQLQEQQRAPEELAAAADRVREWFGRLLDEQSLDIARLYRGSRDRFVARIRAAYEAFLGEAPTLGRARATGAGAALDSAIHDTVDALARELGDRAVDHVQTTLNLQPRVVQRELSRATKLSFRDLPVTTQGVLNELTTTVVGGGTFFDRVLHQTDQFRAGLLGTVRQSLLSGEDFWALRRKVHKYFGVDKLAEPKGPAYDSVKTYRNEALRQWNLMMGEQARAADAVEVWMTKLDERTTPGCAARHGRRVEDLGDRPPRHYNCRCQVLPVPLDADFAALRAEADAWLSAHGYTRRQAAQMEAVREAEWDPAEHPRDPSGMFAVKGRGLVSDRRAGMIAPDGTDYLPQKTHRGGLFRDEDWEDHTDMARRLLGDKDAGVNQARDQGYVRYWRREGEVALEFDARNPQTARNALSFLRKEYESGDRIYLDARGVDEHFFDAPWKAAQAIRRAAGLTEAWVEALTLHEAWDPAKHPRGPEGKFAPKGKALDTGEEDFKRAMMDKFGMSEEQAAAQFRHINDVIARLAPPRVVEPTAKQREGTDPGKKFPGQCYDTAGRYVMDHPDATLVHGTVEQHSGTVIGHAWVEMKDVVFDGTQQQFYDKADYYRVTRAVAERQYTHEEALKQMLREKYFGPWHETAGLVNRPRARRRKEVQWIS